MKITLMLIKKDCFIGYGLLRQSLRGYRQSWNEFYGEIGANMVRGGIKGHHFDEHVQEYLMMTTQSRKLKMSLNN